MNDEVDQIEYDRDDDGDDDDDDDDDGTPSVRLRKMIMWTSLAVASITLTYAVFTRVTGIVKSEIRQNFEVLSLDQATAKRIGNAAWAARDRYSITLKHLKAQLEESERDSQAQSSFARKSALARKQDLDRFYAYLTDHERILYLVTSGAHARELDLSEMELVVRRCSAAGRTILGQDVSVLKALEKLQLTRDPERAFDLVDAVVGVEANVNIQLGSTRRNVPP